MEKNEWQTTKSVNLPDWAKERLAVIQKEQAEKEQRTKSKEAR